MGRLIILCGIPFSGKTTLATAISSKLGYKRIDLDEIKFELFGARTVDSNLMQKDWDLVYQEMYKRIENLLRNGESVVSDTGNFTKHERDLIREIADRLNLKTKTIFVDTPEEIAYERLLENRKSKARFEVTVEDFKKAVREMMPPKEEEDFLVFRYDADIESWIQRYLNK